MATLFDESVKEQNMASDLTSPLEPGIYEDVPFETYLRWDAVSNSKLSRAALPGNFRSHPRLH